MVRTSSTKASKLCMAVGQDRRLVAWHGRQERAMVVEQGLHLDTSAWYGH